MATVHKLVNERRAAAETLLLVEDDLPLLRLREREIAGWNLPLAVLKARNGFEALIRIGQRGPAILVSDLGMRGVDGFRMISTLGADAALAKSAITVVSGLDRSTIHAMGVPADIPVVPSPCPSAHGRAEFAP